MRNLLLGAATFNAIADGAPGMSRSLLGKRLDELERAGVITTTPKHQGRGWRRCAASARPWLTWSHLAPTSMLDPAVPHGWHYYWKSAEFDRLEDATIDAIVDNAAQTTQRSYAVMFHLGGAIQDTPEDATAYSHRHARHNLNINGVWTADHDIAEREIAWTRAFHAAVRPWESGVYTNFWTTTKASTASPRPSAPQP